MDHREEQWFPRCNQCGAELLPETHPTFNFGVSGVLCFPCAVQRGGSFDTRYERWTVPPELSDLEPEARD